VTFLARTVEPRTHAAAAVLPNATPAVRQSRPPTPLPIWPSSPPSPPCLRRPTPLPLLLPSPVPRLPVSPRILPVTAPPLSAVAPPLSAAAPDRGRLRVPKSIHPLISSSLRLTSAILLTEFLTTRFSDPPLDLRWNDWGKWYSRFLSLMSASSSCVSSRSAFLFQFATCFFGSVFGASRRSCGQPQVRVRDTAWWSGSQPQVSSVAGTRCLIHASPSR
jgi:hypothetical protein